MLKNVNCDSEVMLLHRGSSPKQVRQWAGEVFTSWGVDKIHDDAIIVITELITNAMIHTPTPLSIKLQFDRSRVRVEVMDMGGGECPEIVPENWNLENGRGLMMVQSLVKEWGFTSDTLGSKIVWAELVE